MPRWDENGRPIPDAPVRRWDANGKPLKDRPLTQAEQAALDYTRRIAEVSAMAARRPNPPRVRPAETRGQRTQRQGERYAARQRGASGDVQQALGSGILRGVAGGLDAMAYASGGAPGLQGAGIMPSQLLEGSGVTYNPTTDLGSLAEGAGQMLPNALFPGSAATRVAAVAVPTITGEASRILTRENGYDEQSQANMRAAGQFFGGLGIGFLPTRAEGAAASATRPNIPRVKPSTAQRPARVGLPSSNSLALPDAPTVEQMRSLSRVERVPLSAARGQQRRMYWDDFNRGDHPGELIPGYGDRPVAVLREDGEYIIYDGNHRATRALNAGANDMEMYVVRARDYSPELAGRAPAPSRPGADEELLAMLRDELAPPASARPGPPRVKADPNAPANSRGIRAAVATTTPAQMRAEAARLRALGIEPTLVDVTDEAGRGVVRAAASRMTPARTRVQDFAAGRAENLPDRMGQQARRIMSSDPRTPAEIAADLAAQRAASADTAYGAVRGEAVPMPARTAEALRTDYGRAAIREAAKRERDPNVRAALNRLADDALDRPNTPITVGMADRISRVLRGQARAAGADNDLAGLLHGYADDVQAPMREAVPGYGAAVDQYAAQSRIMGAADRGEDFLARNTDEFVASLQDLGPEGLPLARATARRAIERAAGEDVSSAPRVARRLALAPEQQARNRALLGEADAQRLQDAMRAEEQAVANARYVAPNTGSQTQIRGADAAANFVDEAVTAGANVATGNKLGIVRGIIRWARESGLSDADAQLLAEAAIDPARLDAIIASQEARANPRLMSALKQIAARGAPVAALSAVTAMPSAAQARPQPPRQ